MDSQQGVVDGMVDQLAQAPGEGFDSGVHGNHGRSGLPRRAEVSNEWWRAPDPFESPDEAAPASLVGSLSVFPVSDVLSMLASTRQSGELQVVSDSIDGRVWLERGELLSAEVGTATTMGQAIFDLARVNQGSFYFTAGPVSAHGQSPVSVSSVLDQVRPQVEEWQEILAVVPLDAPVALCPDPPGQDVQIRSDQWRVLTTIGNGDTTVGSVLDVIGGDQIVGLRALRDLHAAGLIDLDGAPLDRSGDGPTAGHGWVPDDTTEVDPHDTSVQPIADPSHENPLGVLPPPPSPVSEAVGSVEEDPSTLAEVTMMPPPIAGDPWASDFTSTAAEDNGVA
jgi:hypothetical protein